MSPVQSHTNTYTYRKPISIARCDILKVQKDKLSKVGNDVSREKFQLYFYVNFQLDDVTRV